jgi:CheY-like chemotaxis protein
MEIINPAITILIVDDERQLRSLLARVVQHLGVVAVAGSAPAALRILTGAAFDVVVSDWDLGHRELTGVDVLEFALRKRSDTRTVLMSGSAEAAHGPWQFLAKPFDQATFAQVIGGRALPIPTSARAHAGARAR